LLTEYQVIAAILEVLRVERDSSLCLAVAAIDLRRFLMSKNIDHKERQKSLLFRFIKFLPNCDASDQGGCS
jgi:hypothetical protein